MRLNKKLMEWSRKEKTKKKERDQSVKAETADEFLGQVLDAEDRECDMCGGGPGWHYSGCYE